MPVVDGKRISYFVCRGPKHHNTFTCARTDCVTIGTLKWISKMSYARELYENLEFSTHYIMFVLTLPTLIYGLTSWCVLPKFRNYKNYVCLNAILANLFVSLIMQITNYINEGTTDSTKEICWFAIITLYLLMYLASVKHHWLIVICHMFYLDIVKVFNVHIRWKYLKSILFGWGLPSIITLVHFFVTSGYFFESDVNPSDLGFIIFIFTVTINCLLYIRIVYSLCRTSNASACTTTNKWRCLYIATLLFILSDILLLSFHVVSFMNHLNTKKHDLDEYPDDLVIDPHEQYPLLERKKLVMTIIDNKLIYFLQILIYNLNPLLLNVYLIVVRSNRQLWYEFYENKIKRRSLPVRVMDHDIHMQERITGDPGDVQPAALDI